jgi:hypothetical protein
VLLALSGVNPVEYIETEDDLLRGFLEQVAERRQEYDRARDENLAVLIANKVMEGFK